MCVAFKVASSVDRCGNQVKLSNESVNQPINRRNHYKFRQNSVQYLHPQRKFCRNEIFSIFLGFRMASVIRARFLGETRGRCKNFINSKIRADSAESVLSVSVCVCVSVLSVSVFVQTATTGLQQRRSSVNNTAQICIKIPPHYCNLFSQFFVFKNLRFKPNSFSSEQKMQRNLRPVSLGRTLIDQVWPKTHKGHVSDTNMYIFFQIPDHILFSRSHNQPTLFLLLFHAVAWTASFYHIRRKKKKTDLLLVFFPSTVINT